MQVRWDLDNAIKVLRDYVHFDKLPYCRKIERNELLFKIFQDRTKPIYDLTLGLARDAWLFCRLGFVVHGFEQNLHVFRVLESALEKVSKIESWSKVADRLHLYQKDSIHFLQEIDHLSGYLYSDPMFPLNVNQKALPSKELQALRYLCHDQEPWDWILVLSLLKRKIDGKLVVKVHRSFAHKLPKPDQVRLGNQVSYYVYHGVL